LFEYSIYPSEDELREVVEDFLAENHTEFYDSMTDKKWNTYYKKNIAQLVYIFNFVLFVFFHIIKNNSKYFKYI